MNHRDKLSFAKFAKENRNKKHCEKMYMHKVKSQYKRLRIEEENSQWDYSSVSETEEMLLAALDVAITFKLNNVVLELLRDSSEFLTAFMNHCCQHRNIELLQFVMSNGIEINLDEINIMIPYRQRIAISQTEFYQFLRAIETLTN